jgi:mono/diheme cytochrome c family protein
VKPSPARVPVLLALAFATGTASGDEWKAPEAERVRSNPVATTPATLQKGRALYQKLCATCHGDKGLGDGAAAPFNAEKPPSLADPKRQRTLTDGEMLWKITTGRKEEDEVLMPAMAEKIPAEEDRWKLVSFVRTLAGKAEGAASR